MRAPTISEVAKTAGVSVATVSRVVNGSPSVSHETQARVQEAIERLGYQPNVWGRSLRRGESRVVLVIVPNVSNPYYAPIIAGTEDRLHEDGYSGMLCITNAEAERRALYLEFLKDGRADGAILMEPARDDPHVTGMARHYHLVQCSEYCDNQAVSHVSVDNLAAAREVVLTLAGLGHRRIGFIGADNDFMSTIARRQGYLDGLRVLNIPPREDDQTFAGRDYSFASGVEAARRLLARLAGGSLRPMRWIMRVLTAPLIKYFRRRREKWKKFFSFSAVWSKIYHPRTRSPAEVRRGNQEREAAADVSLQKGWSSDEDPLSGPAGIHGLSADRRAAEDRRSQRRRGEPDPTGQRTDPDKHRAFQRHRKPS